MSNQGYILQNQSPSPASGYTAISGAAPQTVTGNTLSIPNPISGAGKSVVPGSLSAYCVMNVTANTMTLTGKWEVSANGSTWIEAKTANGAANVALVTGTGGLVTTKVAVSAPDAVYGWSKVRFKLVSGAAAGGGAGVDEASISYNFRVGSTG